MISTYKKRPVKTTDLAHRACNKCIISTQNMYMHNICILYYKSIAVYFKEVLFDIKKIQVFFAKFFGERFDVFQGKLFVVL